MTELEEFIFMKKLFNTSYVSAENMHKYISQMNDMIKTLECLDIAIDPQILRSLIINQLRAHFSEFQAQKQNFNFSKVSLEKLFSQMLRENEVQYYQKEKNTLYDKKSNTDKSKKKLRYCKKYKKKTTHTLDNCWKLHLEKKEK